MNELERLELVLSRAKDRINAKNCNGVRDPNSFSAWEVILIIISELRKYNIERARS